MSLARDIKFLEMKRSNNVFGPQKQYKGFSAKKQKQVNFMRLNQRQSLINPQPTRQVVEKKNLDVPSAISGGAANVFGTIVPLNLCAQGVLASQRVGRKIQMKSLLLKWKTDAIEGATDVSPFRVLVVYDKQTNGILPAVTDILTQNMIIVPNNLSYADRFITLMDFMTDPQQNTSQSLCGTQFRKLNLEAMYQGAGGTIAEINTGGVYILVANPTNADSMNFFARIRYTDI